MTELDSWVIYWRDHTERTYLYGAEILFHSKVHIEYRNNLMPPGTVIKSWQSKYNYQMDKLEPSLPMIDGESDYVIKTDIDCNKESGWLLRLVFFDKFGAEADSLIIRDAEAPFRCPLKTYYYRLDLLGAGATEIHFHSITISEVSYEEDERPEKASEKAGSGKKLRKQNKKSDRRGTGGKNR